MTSYIDSKGVERELPIARESCTVTDPNIGILRQIVAGQPVPPDLVEAYEQEVGIAAKDKPADEPADGDAAEEKAADQPAGKKSSRRAPAPEDG